MLRYAEILRYAERKIIDKAASQSLSFIKPIMYVMSDLNQILLFVLLFEHFSCASPTRITRTLPSFFCSALRKLVIHLRIHSRSVFANIDARFVFKFFIDCRAQSSY